MLKNTVKMNKYTTHQLIVALGMTITLLNVCQNIQSKEYNTEKNVLEEQQTKTAEDSLTIAVRQLDQYTYILNDEDSIKFEKPMLKFFTGKLGNKDVQLWLFYCLPIWEELNPYYSYEGFWSIDGSSIVRISFNEENDKYVAKFYKDEEKIEPVVVLEYIESKNQVIAKSNSETYILKENALKFDAYDRFVYENTYCERDDWSGYRKHWEYDFSYIVNTIPPELEPCFQKAITSDDSNSNASSIKNWKHHINPVLRKASIDDENNDEVCFHHWRQTYTLPIYLDSVVYVISSFGHAYMGGAHGMYFTTYNCYDTQSGESLALEDIIDTENKSFEEFYNEKMIKQFELEEFTESVEMPSSFYIVPGGILFHYPGYSLRGGFWEKESFFTFDELEPYLKRKLYPVN